MIYDLAPPLLFMHAFTLTTNQSIASRPAPDSSESLKNCDEVRQDLRAWFLKRPSVRERTMRTPSGSDSRSQPGYLGIIVEFSSSRD